MNKSNLTKASIRSTAERSTKTSATLKERLLDVAQSESSDGDARSFIAEDGASAIFADSPDDGNGNEVFVEFPRSKKESFAFPFEFYFNGRRAFAGNWSTEIWADASPLKPIGRWETVCEETEDNYAFLERTVSTTGGRLFSRRLLAARNEALFLVADSIFGAESDRARAKSSLFRYRSALPLDSETDAEQDVEAREISLFETKNEKRSAFARVFPTSASEWRADASSGNDCRLENGAILTTSERRGGSLFVATLIDGNPRRAKRPCSWRPLTVGENLRAVDDDSAVGREIQLGRERFVLYASTSARPKIRSILGRNLLSDFMFGKFFIDRGVEPIVDVEVLDE